MRQLVRRSTATLAAITLIGALGACSDDEPSTNGDTTPSPTPSETSPSPSTTPTGPIEPEVPDAMGVESKRGAKAFISYYWEVVDYAQASGDLKTLRGLHFPSCDPCEGGIKALAAGFKKGERLEGGAHTIEIGRVQELQDVDGRRGFQVAFTMTSTAQTAFGPDGSVVERYEPGSAKLRLVVHMVSSDDWKIGYWESAS